MSNSFLDLQPISRIRRNHGLEHATIHVLRQKHPNVNLGGVSSPVGFVIIGNLTTEDVAEGAIEALKKLRAGEADLAIHPNCGTNFAISGAFAGLFAWMGTIGTGKKFSQKVERLPLMILLATFGLILSQSIGSMVQEQITTSGDPGALELERVETIIRAGMRLQPPPGTE